MESIFVIYEGLGVSHFASHSVGRCDEDQYQTG